MTLGELISRIYNVLGDDEAAPREFPRQPLVDAANRGCLAFRVQCHEVWRRADIPAIANQGEYTIPPDMLSIQRVAYDDASLESRASNTLQSRDAHWLTQTGQPISFTSYGLAHNKFRLWPIPAEGSDEVHTWSSDYGVVVRYQQPPGTDYVFSSEFGIVTEVDGHTLSSNYGEIMYIPLPESHSITIWATDKPTVLVDDAQEIPIRKPWQIAILYFVLWAAYDEEGDHHNQVLGAWYRDQFFDQVARCKERVSTSVATQVTKLRAGTSNELGDIQYGDVIVNGVPIPVIW